MGIKILSWEGMVAAYIAVVAMLASQAGIAQQKQNLERKDYHKWGTLYAEQVSPTGEWVSFSMKYHGGNDTLMLANRTGTALKFPGGKSGRFANDNYFAYILPERRMVVLDLQTFVKQEFTGVMKFAFTGNGKYLLDHRNEANGIAVLDIRGPSGDLLHSIAGVNDYLLNPPGDAILYKKADGESYTLGVMNIRDGKEDTIKEGNGSITDWAWQSDGTALAFLSKSGSTTAIGFYQPKTRKLDEMKESVLGNAKHFATSNSNKLTISGDGQKVFFATVADEVLNTKPSNVEIWDSADKWTYDKKSGNGSWESWPKTTVWSPGTGKLLQIASDSLPHAITGNRQRYFVQFNPEGTEKAYKFFNDTKYWLYDIETERRDLVLERHSANTITITISPQENFVLYYTRENWWLYDIRAKQHRNLTGKIPAQWADAGENYAGEKPSYDFAGWTPGDRSVLVYDKNDIWEIDTGNGAARRLSNGKEKGLVFRFAKNKGEPARKMAHDGLLWPVWQPKQQWLLKAEAEDGTHSGYFSLKYGGTPKEIIYQQMKVDHLLSPLNGSGIYFRAQRFDKAPALQYVSAAGSKAIYQSNKQQDKYHWGTARQITYSNSQGKELKAAVFYPANYDPLKKYPTIVHVYQKLSATVNDYVNPGMDNEIGFNISNLTTSGYLVLCPDIEYVIGDPGKSAAGCIIAAANKAIEMGLADPARIALHGFSFGGYETAFTISQTNLFCTAIAGAAATDMASWYFTMGWNDRTPHMWRFENQQWRMGKSYFEDIEGYNRNSPVYNAPKINTPLLTWAGKTDGQVNWEQGMELYLALRRLDKKNTFLLFPTEGHGLMEYENRKTLTEKIEQWLGHYLKGREAGGWMGI